MIKESERLKALEKIKTITFKQHARISRAPYFVLAVKDQLETLLENNADKGLLEQGGLTIKTSLDWELQQVAEKQSNRARMTSSGSMGRTISRLLL